MAKGSWEFVYKTDIAKVRGGQNGDLMVEKFVTALVSVTYCIFLTYRYLDLYRERYRYIILEAVPNQFLLYSAYMNAYILFYGRLFHSLSNLCSFEHLHYSNLLLCRSMPNALFHTCGYFLHMYVKHTGTYSSR